MKSSQLLLCFLVRCEDFFSLIELTFSLVPNVFLRPHAQRSQADAAHAEFAHPDGDHLTLLNVYHSYKNNCPDPSTASQWCWQNYLSYRTLQQADNVRSQLQRTMERFDLDLVSTSYEDKSYYTNIRKALTCG